MSCSCGVSPCRRVGLFLYVSIVMFCVYCVVACAFVVALFAGSSGSGGLIGPLNDLSFRQRTCPQKDGSLHLRQELPTFNASRKSEKQTG